MNSTNNDNEQPAYAEPYWMQDIRLAQRLIARQRPSQCDSASVPWPVADDIEASEE